MSEVSFSDRNGGSVAVFSELIESLTGDNLRDSAEAVISVFSGLAIESAAEGIELFFVDLEDSEDVVEIGPVVDEVFEGILVEPEALDGVVNATAADEIVVGSNATERGTAGVRGGNDGDFWSRFFRSGRTA